MSKAKLIKQEGVDDLRERVKENAHLYRDGGFEEKISADKIMEDPSVEVDEKILSRLNPENTENIRVVDIQNALLVFKSLKGMHPHLARDERFWVYLTHTHCRDYTWKRWFPLGAKGLSEDASEEEKEEFEKSIRDRFFVRGSDDLVRNNAVARLWWWAYIASRYEGKDSDDKAVQLEKTLRVLFTTTGVRTALVNRPSIARGVNGFSAVMDVLIERHDKDPKAPLFKTTRCGAWLKEINRHGGVLLLEAMPREKLRELFEELAVQAEQG